MKERKSLMRNLSGTTLLIEQCQKITIFEVTKRAKEQLLPTLMKNIATTEGFNVDFTTSRLFHGGERLWFKCPICSKRVAIVYKSPLNSLIGCRSCLGLEYKSRRYKGMVENTI